MMPTIKKPNTTSETMRNVAVLPRKGPFLRFMDYVEVARVLRVCASAATTFFLTLSSVTSALGYPHMWVDLESRVVLNIDDGSVACYIFSLL